MLRRTITRRALRSGSVSMACALACSLGACSKSDEAQMAKASAKTPSASVAPPEEASPRQREAQPTPSEKLGTRPESLGLDLGDQAPDADLRDADNKPIKLSTLWHQTDVLLIFYRGGWCPYCNYQLRQLSNHLTEFQSRKVVPVAISVDRPGEAIKTRGSYEIRFPVLSDPELIAVKAYRVLRPVDASEYHRMLSNGVDLERRTGNQEHAIAVPSMFLIDTEGIVRWVHVDPDYKERPSIEQLTTILDRILKDKEEKKTRTTEKGLRSMAGPPASSAAGAKR